MCVNSWWLPVLHSFLYHSLVYLFLHLVFMHLHVYTLFFYLLTHELSATQTLIDPFTKLYIISRSLGFMATICLVSFFFCWNQFGCLDLSSIVNLVMLKMVYSHVIYRTKSYRWVAMVSWHGTQKLWPIKAEILGLGLPFVDPCMHLQFHPNTQIILS